MDVIGDIIAREGGYNNHPADAGGPTKFGITLRTLSQWRNAPCTAMDVQSLTEQEVRKIYETLYASPFSRFMQHEDLFALCVDSAVQHGVARVQGWLKDIPSADPVVNYRGLFRTRLKFYGEIITRTPEQAVFAKGWLSRLAEFAR